MFPPLKANTCLSLFRVGVDLKTWPDARDGVPTYGIPRNYSNLSSALFNIVPVKKIGRLVKEIINHWATSLNGLFLNTFCVV